MIGCWFAQFGLELLVSTQAPDKIDGGSDISVESIIAARKHTHPNELCFAIPVASVGGIIGKGGHTLKELQAEFAVRVFIHKEEYQGQRIVVLRCNGSDDRGGGGDGDDATSRSHSQHTGGGGMGKATVDRVVLVQCQQRILSMVDDSLLHKTSI